MRIAAERDGERRADDADAQLAEVLGERHDVVGRLHARPLGAAPERVPHDGRWFGARRRRADAAHASPLSVRLISSSSAASALPAPVAAPARRVGASAAVADPARTSPCVAVGAGSSVGAPASVAAPARRPSSLRRRRGRAASSVVAVGSPSVKSIDLLEQVGRLAHLLHRLVEHAAASRPGSCCPSSSARRTCARPGAARRAASPGRARPAPAAGSRRSRCRTG